MTPTSSPGRREPFDASSERRRARRQPLPGVLVTLERPRSRGPSWAGDAVDICADGLALAMTPDIAVPCEVLVSFELAGTWYQRLPAVVLRQDPAACVGAVRFLGWPPAARQSLQAYLAS